MRQLYLLFFYLLLLTLPIGISAQVQIHFQPNYAGEPLTLNHYYKYSEKDSVQITDLQFYITHIKLYKKGKLVFSDSSAHLIAYNNIDSDSARLIINLNTPQKLRFDELHFSLGIDSATNVAGAIGGDLDPTLGMYWAWQSGYINFKIEGNSNLCATRKNEYKFHLGGYLPPCLALQNLKFKAQKNTLALHFDIEKSLKIIDLSQKSQIMSPSPQAVIIAQKIAQNFTLTAKK